MLPGCDYNHWLIVMEFPKDPAPTREQMIETYLNTLATVLGRYSFKFFVGSVCFRRENLVSCDLVWFNLLSFIL